MCNNAWVRVPVSTPLYFSFNGTRHYSILKPPHQLIRLLCQTQSQNLAISVSKYTHVSNSRVSFVPCAVVSLPDARSNLCISQANLPSSLFCTDNRRHPSTDCRSGCTSSTLWCLSRVVISSASNASEVPKLTWRVHNATDDKATGSTTRKMQCWPFFHAQMPH